jgi:hypothetical protein
MYAGDCVLITGSRDDPHVLESWKQVEPQRRDERR